VCVCVCVCLCVCVSVCLCTCIRMSMFACVVYECVCLNLHMRVCVHVRVRVRRMQASRMQASVSSLPACQIPQFTILPTPIRQILSVIFQENLHFTYVSLDPTVTPFVAAHEFTIPVCTCIDKRYAHAQSCISRQHTPHAVSADKHTFYVHAGPHFPHSHTLPGSSPGF